MFSDFDLQYSPDGKNLGLITKKNSHLFTVRSGQRTLACALSTRLRKDAGPERPARGRGAGKNASQPLEGLTVGDRVRFEETAGGPTIVEILPRRNWISRRTAVPMPGAHAFEQVIAANVDLVAPVFAAASPEPHWNMLDRYLVSAESAGLPAMVLITKLDLAPERGTQAGDRFWDGLEDYRQAGYPIILVSAHTGRGLDEVRQALSGRLTIMMGKSGVGKTSLLNALQPGLGQRVNEVNSVTGKGRHTTTHLEMFPLEEIGGAIIDTPGVREFGLWDVDQADMAELFPEMRPFLGTCRFGLGCTHDEEPGCAVRKAVMAGQISPRRYASLMKLRQEP